MSGERVTKPMRIDPLCNARRLPGRLQRLLKSRLVQMMPAHHTRLRVRRQARARKHVLPNSFARRIALGAHNLRQLLEQLSVRGRRGVARVRVDCRVWRRRRRRQGRMFGRQLGSRFPAKIPLHLAGGIAARQVHQRKLLAKYIYRVGRWPRTLQADRWARGVGGRCAGGRPVFQSSVRFL